MIPKIIHYCWFGGNPKSEDVKACIASWKKFCPGYEIREWNESNFDINANDYCHSAYEARKWAFVADYADYARVKVLEEYGGIYMDTDVEVVKCFDELLHYEAFMCFESPKNVFIGTFGAEAYSNLLRDLQHIYDQLSFAFL